MSELEGNGKYKNDVLGENGKLLDVYAEKLSLHRGLLDDELVQSAFIKIGKALSNAHSISVSLGSNQNQISVIINTVLKELVTNLGDPEPVDPNKKFDSVGTSRPLDKEDSPGGYRSDKNRNPSDRQESTKELECPHCTGKLRVKIERAN